jgi:universal stress protein A
MPMSAYATVLLALDLCDESAQVVERARELVTDKHASVVLLHVVEPSVAETSYDLITSLPSDLDSARLKQAETFLRRTGEDSGLPGASIRVESGSVKTEILRVAEEIAADLIMVGTHGRHGMGLLLGSTANSVLHGTPCDVLAVRIRPGTAGEAS